MGSGSDVAFDCCGIVEEEEKQDGNGRDLKSGYGVVVQSSTQSGVPNRAEQLAGHGIAWSSTALLRADVTCCHF